MELLLRVEGARGGAENMAIDRALLECAERGELRSPLLRVYSWSPPAVSLGFHQDSSTLDLEAMSSRGIELVRRPTGGAAVLHAEEWTYSVAGVRGLEGLGRGFAEIYRNLADAMVEALQSLGIDARSGGRGAPESFVCFEALQGHEISVEGRKLVGSAFRQTRHAFVQHGSLLLGPGHLELVELMRGLDPEQARRRKEELAERTVHLTELGCGDLEGRTFAEALAAAIARRMGLMVVELDNELAILRNHLAILPNRGESTEESSGDGRILP